MVSPGKPVGDGETLMGARVEFRLLGPLLVLRDGATVPIPAGRPSALLAALLLNAGHVVPTEQLIEAVWGDSPPPSARVTVQNHVKRLRKVLGDVSHRRIRTYPNGYMINVEPGMLDVERFEELVHSARKEARESAWDRAASQLRDALSLWRDQPLANVDSAALAVREVPQLEEKRLQALEARIDADLHLGRHREVITELQQLADAYPLREHLDVLLILALYRDGRQAEALAAYQQARQLLIEELGAEPGIELQELHQRILSADPALTPAEPIPSAPVVASVVPRELPTTVPQFTGRMEELGALTELMERSSDAEAGAPMISVIGGTAGVGKTALAVRWAHHVAPDFPDGQLYADLRGYDPGRPVPTTDVLAGFLRGLGMPADDVPVREDERAARYRTLVSGRRILIVLDNAGSVEQVRPLLPGSACCPVVVTSRDALAGLVARDGATRLDLDVLPLGDSAKLLRELIGPRIDDSPEAAEALTTQCSRLPLALRTAAEFAAAHPAASLTDLVEDLSDPAQRLDLLDADGDPHTSVRSVFSWSYRHLAKDVARTFRLIGLHPGPVFDSKAAAALTGMTIAGARHVLEALIRASLVQHVRSDRYHMHDLLHAYAHQLAHIQESEQERRMAIGRLQHHYLHTPDPGGLDALA